MSAQENVIYIHDGQVSCLRPQTGGVAVTVSRAIRFEDERKRDHDGSVSGGPAAARLVGGRVHAPGRRRLPAAALPEVHRAKPE